MKPCTLTGRYITHTVGAERFDQLTAGIVSWVGLREAARGDLILVVEASGWQLLMVVTHAEEDEFSAGVLASVAPVHLPAPMRD